MEILDSQSKYLAFGCSYTQYGYPTYADFIGQAFDVRENLGQSGAGNRYIFHKVVATLDMLKRNKIKLTKDDLITIQWSGLPREDKLRTGVHYFETPGYLGSQGVFPDEYVNTYFSLEQNFFELLNYISILKLAFESLDVQYRMFYMMDPTLEDFLGEAFFSNMFDEQSKNLKTNGYLGELKKVLPLDIESIETFRIKYTMDKEPPYCYAWKNEETDEVEINDDTHPTPYAHAEYAKYLSSTLDKDVLKEGNFDFSSVIAQCDDYFNLSNLKADAKKGIARTQEHLPLSSLGLKDENFNILAHTRGTSIIPYLEQYKPVM